ncbi:MAG TPA: helix-turn-helix domain-containing protein [Terriglobales bacterium]|jgi:excisionase family DNA binding protein
MSTFFEPLLSAKQAAEMLGGIHLKTLQKMARANQIPGHRIGRAWFFRASELDQWLRLESSGQADRSNGKEHTR